jgi:glutaredoxin
MRIIVFGADRCKFCKKQIAYLKETFPDSDWVYVDVVKDKEGFAIANQVNVENLPTVILLDEGNKIIYKKSGTLSPDKIFKILHNIENSIPVNLDEKSMLTVLSYDPGFKKGQKIKVYSYSGDPLFEATVKLCNEEKVEKMAKNLKEKYQKIGGRKDIGWIVKFVPLI